MRTNTHTHTRTHARARTQNGKQVVVCIHRVRVSLMSAVSVAFVAPGLSDVVPRALQRQLFPTAFASHTEHTQHVPPSEHSPAAPSQAAQTVGETEEVEAAEEKALHTAGEGEETGWLVKSCELAQTCGLLRLDTLHVPHSYLRSTQSTPHQDGAPQDAAAPSRSSSSSSTASSTSSGAAQWSRKRADEVRALASAEMLVLTWQDACKPGAVLMIGRLLARRASSALMPLLEGGAPGRAGQGKRRTLAAATEHAFEFKVLLTSVPRGDAGAVGWLSDKINRKLDVSRWRSFIAVARRRMRMQRPQKLDAAFLLAVAREAVEELDLRAADVPGLVDIKLLLASRAMDHDWLTRPQLHLLPHDMIPVNYLDALHDHQEHHDHRDDLPPAVQGHDLDVPHTREDKHKETPAPRMPPGFSVLRDVAAGSPQVDSPKTQAVQQATQQEQETEAREPLPHASTCSSALLESDSVRPPVASSRLPPLPPPLLALACVHHLRRMLRGADSGSSGTRWSWYASGCWHVCRACTRQLVGMVCLATA